METHTAEKKSENSLPPDSFALQWKEASQQLQTCIVRSTLHVLRGKWKLLILSLMLDQPRRYGELKASMPEVSEKMLIQHLKELEQDQLIIRTSYPEVPPRVEYQLSGHGHSLRPVFDAMLQWGKTYLGDPGVQALRCSVPPQQH